MLVLTHAHCAWNSLFTIGQGTTDFGVAANWTEELKKKKKKKYYSVFFLFVYVFLLLPFPPVLGHLYKNRAEEIKLLGLTPKPSTPNNLFGLAVLLLALSHDCQSCLLR